jgi:hypothetical protein
MTTEDRDDRGVSDARTSPESLASPSSDLSPLVSDVPPPEKGDKSDKSAQRRGRATAR